MLIIVSILPQAPELQRLPTLRFVNISPKNWFLTMAHCIETILQEIHLSLRWVRKSGAWSQTSKHPHITFHVRLQNSFLVFLKIGLPRSTREILERISRASHAHVDREKKFRVSPQFHSLFSPRSGTFVWPLLRSWPTQKYGQYCSLLLFSIFEAWQPTRKGPCFCLYFNMNTCNEWPLR